MVALEPSLVQSLTCSRNEDPFIFSTDLVRQLQLLAFARKVLAVACHLVRPPRLPSSRGRPDAYPEEVILVTVMVMTVWQLSPNAMVRRLHRWPDIADACGYALPDIISVSQFYRRRDRPGLWVCHLLRPGVATHRPRRHRGRRDHHRLSRDRCLCRGKKTLATLAYIRWWHDARGKRGYIERFFALLKRYYGLNDVQVLGLYKVWRHTFETCIVVLIVAWLSIVLGRPDLMHSKSRLLAPC